MRLRLAAGLAALLLLFGACGGADDGNDGVASIDDSDSDSEDSESDDGGGGGNRPSPEEQAKAEEAALKYVECMRGEGIDMPDPEFEEGGGIGITMEADGSIDQEAMEAAEEKCGPLLEEGMPRREMSPEEKAELQDQLLEMAQCMRDRGHDFEDPVVDDNGGVRIGSGPGGEDPSTGRPPDDEQFQKDMEECNEEAGMGGPAGPAGGGGSRNDEADDE